MTTDDFVGHLVNNATGTGYPAVRADDFQRVDLLKPTDRLLQTFHKIVEPFYDQVHILENQIVAASKARDLLLPRLMSGEIAV